MENLKINLTNLDKALKTLKEAIDMDFTVVVRDAVIQRFEYTFELLWKTIKAYLKEKEGIICNSPKSCFRELFSLNLIKQKETEILLEMTDKRNLTSHTYIETIAQEIYSRIIKEYFVLMKSVMKKLL